MSLRRSGSSGEIVRAYPADKTQGRLVFASTMGARVEQRISALTNTSRAVLFTGDIGTGKSLLARALHERAHTQALVHVACASVTDSEIAELAYSGLRTLSAQGGGTLLLDEVAELSPWAQAVVLASLERTQAGSHGVRLISTTHRSMHELVRQGRFSARLADLLSEEVVALSPLRERRSEVVPLALHHLRVALTRTAWDFVSIDPLVLSLLERHDWPGNARELKNVMEHALALAVDGDISVRELPESLVRVREAALLG